ncbi:MAG: hypothetical protein SGBAC_005445 [Bacillariaceae sp.]
MAEPNNESSIRQTHSPKAEAKLRLAEGSATGDSAASNIPPPNLHSSNISHASNTSHNTERSRLESIKSSASGGEKDRGRRARHNASEPTETVSVGAQAVSGDVVSSRPTVRSTEKQRRQQQSSGAEPTDEQEFRLGADEELGLQNSNEDDMSEGKETLLEAVVAPDLEALVQQRLEEERQNQQNNNTNDNNAVVATVFTAAEEEDSDDENGNNQSKRIIQVLILFIVFVAGVIAAALLINQDEDPGFIPAPATNTSAGPTPTMAPTSPSPTVPRLEQIETSLADKIGDDYRNDETMVWVIENDTWSPPSTAADPGSLWKERYSMAKLYFSTNGARWSFGNSWLSPNSVCDWGCCDTSFELVVCGDEDDDETSGRIVSLNLEQKELQASLPMDIFDDMTAMTSLSINDNKLFGSFPRFPPNIEFVGIYANNFSGSIPSDFFTGLTKLASLGMSNNDMTGELPPLPPNVESCWLNNNRFSGSVSPDFFTGYTKLTHMTFTNNQLSGSLPLLPPNLVRGWLDSNDFSGSLATDYFTDLTALTHITVGNNRLSGSIPPLTTNLAISNACWFDDNCFTDVANGRDACGISGNVDCNAASSSPTISTPPPSPTAAPSSPPTVDRFPVLQASLGDKFGDDYRNDDTMRWLIESDVWVPPSNATDHDALWKERYAMAGFYFSTSGWAFPNSWLTPDPVCDWGCCNASRNLISCDESGRVVLLDLSEKALEGSLPMNIFDDMTAMTYLDISTNNLSGSFPRFPPSLEFVGIYANTFSGSIPQDFFTGLTKLASLGMSNNGMTGELPPLPPNLESCWLNNNKFSGSISRDFFTPYTKLTHMTFTNNQLTGSLPLLPSNLVRGWLNQNDFSGSLSTDYFTALTALTHISLGDNRLSGSIPRLLSNVAECWFEGNCFSDVSNGQGSRFLRLLYKKSTILVPRSPGKGRMLWNDSDCVRIVLEEAPKELCNAPSPTPDLESVSSSFESMLAASLLPRMNQNVDIQPSY